MRIVTATLGLWMGVVQVLSVSADTDNGRSISSEDLLMQILHAHDAAIEQLSVLRFDYAREVFEERRSQDGEFTIVSNIKGRETRSRDLLQCLVSYSSEFPDGGGDIYSDSWEKALIAARSPRSRLLRA
jgi:hypothetical protein